MKNLVQMMIGGHHAGDHMVVGFKST